MNQLIPEYDTPLPGGTVSDGEAAAIKKAFLAKFRGVDHARVPSNIPTACVLQGHDNPAYLKESRFLNRKSIFFYTDGGGLRRSNPVEVLHYLEVREPWESYDICLFDETLSWCVGITHNDSIIVVDDQSKD